MLLRADKTARRGCTKDRLWATSSLHVARCTEELGFVEASVGRVEQATVIQKPNVLNPGLTCSYQLLHTSSTLHGTVSQTLLGELLFWKVVKLENGPFLVRSLLLLSRPWSGWVHKGYGGVREGNSVRQLHKTLAQQYPLSPLRNCMIFYAEIWWKTHIWF